MKNSYKMPEMANDGFASEPTPQRMSVSPTVVLDNAVMYDSFKEECIASVRDAEEEYSKTGMAIGFEEMMAEFKKEFKW